MNSCRTLLFGVLLTGQVLLPCVPALAQEVPRKRALPQLTVNLETVPYPETARIAAVQGRVLVVFTITKRGRADEPIVMAAEPVKEFDEAAIRAIKQIRFTVPEDWVATGGPEYHFQISVLFKLSPCNAPACISPEPHEAADDFLIISAQTRH